MIAIPTDRHRHRHANVCVRWKPDRHWMLSSIVGLVVAGGVSVVLLLSLWYAP